VPKGMLDWGSTFDLPFPRRKRITRPAKIFATIFLFVGLIFIILSFAASDDLLKWTDNPIPISVPTRLVSLISGVIYAVTGGFFLFIFRRRHPKTLALS
jgi:membrane associated rhomboid family serine protease